MVLYLIAPCYNEEKIIEESAHTLSGVLCALISEGKIAPESRVLYVDDGSRDATWQRLKAICESKNEVCALRLSRNRGQQNALYAALMYARERCDAAITLDADLQDDISKIPQMLDLYCGGAKIVYGVRSDRRSDTFFKRTSANVFYKLLTLLGVEIIENHADFRLMAKEALDALAEFGEVNLFLRGIVPQIGFETAFVSYERKVRIGGETKYPLRRMAAFSLDGVTSFSVKPIRFISAIGAAVFLVSIGMLIYSLVQHFLHNTVIGWSSLIVSVWALGGLQLLAIGVIGEYIGKIYTETKKRPRYFISETAGTK